MSCFQAWDRPGANQNRKAGKKRESSAIQAMSLMGMKGIIPSTIYEDKNFAKDFHWGDKSGAIKTSDIRFAYANPGNFYIRDSCYGGHPTELHKIITGNVDYLFCQYLAGNFSDPQYTDRCQAEEHPQMFMLLDLQVFREFVYKFSDLNDISIQKFFNDSTSETFRVFNIRKFPMEFILAISDHLKRSWGSCPALEKWFNQLSLWIHGGIFFRNSFFALLS